MSAPSKQVVLNCISGGNFELALERSPTWTALSGKLCSQLLSH